MALPVWDADTVRKYKGRWNALQRVGRRIENEPTTNDTSRLLLKNSAFPEPEDVSPPFERIEVRDPDGQLLQSFFRLGNQYVQTGFAEATVEETDSERRPLRYNALYEGIAHLLTTQPGNPPYESLIRHLDGEKNRRAYYQEISIPKKRGGERTLTVPHHPLKWLQRSLLTVFTHLFPRHKCAHGFERGKSIVTHAKHHTGKKYVYTIDIKDFFPSITRNRVFGMLQAYPINASQPVARYLANLTCHNGSLPQGAPTSPILSNLLCRRLDSRLFKWARQNGYTYSRYADDLTFSTNNDSFPDSDIAFIDDIIQDEGFEVNEEKRRLQPYYRRQMVTGLVVNEKVNLPREKLRGLRALLRNIEEHGWRSQVNRDCVFDDADEWRSYINADLSRSEFRNIDQMQSKRDRLLNPAATLPRVEDVDDLREVVRGKIAFVGAVRGEGDDMYQRFLSRYTQLSSRLDRFQEGKRKGGQRIRSGEDEREREVERRENAPRHYANLSRWLKELDKGALSPSEFREKLGDWRDHSLEINWLLDRREDISTAFRREAKRIAHGLDTSPYETARFFRKFNNYLGFRGLLHPPSDPSTPPSELIGACEKLVEQYTLPNGLQFEARKVLKECNNWVDVNDRYPWPPEGEPDTPVKKEHLVPFKQHTRFNPRKEEEALIPRLQEHASKLRDSGVDFDFPRKGKRFRTHVPSVLPALKRLLSSMAEHTKSATIHVSVDKVETAGLPGVVIQIWDEDSFIEADSTLSSILSGNTREVLYHQTADTGLRGYARWTLIAPFEHEDGPAYEFDVTQNVRSEAPNHDVGVMHRVTFPQ
jgi:retron-type reverse transcriptase